MNQPEPLEVADMVQLCTAIQETLCLFDLLAAAQRQKMFSPSAAGLISLTDNCRTALLGTYGRVREATFPDAEHTDARSPR